MKSFWSSLRQPKYTLLVSLCPSAKLRFFSAFKTAALMISGMIDAYHLEDWAEIVVSFRFDFIPIPIYASKFLFFNLALCVFHSPVKISYVRLRQISMFVWGGGSKSLRSQS
ncbi:hypothetical protein SDJN02_22639, partial [Cucurbita argyrosperma subsp. argyrosperma]